MKKLSLLLLLPFFYSCSSDDSIDDSNTTKSAATVSDYRNFYGITWVGTIDDNLKYAQQMGYDCVFYRYGMENHPDAKKLKFYLIEPEFYAYTRHIDTKKTYTDVDKDFYSRFLTLKDASKPFPHNLARGWFDAPTVFSTEPDFQQQRVVDYVVDKILEKIAWSENKNIGFEFAGFAWDVPQLTGDFWDTIYAHNGVRLGSQVTLSHWTGKDSGSKHPDVIHDYATYSDGRAAFYKTLIARTREKYPNARTIMEPYNPYRDYIKHIENRPDAKYLVPDLLMQESAGTDFVTDANVYQKQLIDYTHVGSTTPNIFGEDNNRLVAGTAAQKGAWFTWFGRFGGSGDMPSFNHVTEVPSRLQLVRVIPNWENLHSTPLNERIWKDGIYSSPKAYISKDVIYAVQPSTNKLFVVFLNQQANVKIPVSDTVLKAYSTNTLFIEEDAPSSDITISGGYISLKNTNGVGKGYILK